MSWKRDLAEGLVLTAGALSARVESPPANPRSVFVLRNNDLGDLLVITPLFQALKELYPHASIVAGIGSWSRMILAHNPYVSEIMEVNAPWHNQVVVDQSPLAALQYIYLSEESARLTERRMDIGIDVVGSALGALLLIKAGIPYRLGVRGLVGGHSGMQACVTYNPLEHVGRSALRFAEILGAKSLPANYPQIYLSDEEIAFADKFWSETVSDSASETNHAGKRVVVSHGGGFAAKRWPLENFLELTKALSLRRDLQLALLGGATDIESGQEIASAANTVTNRVGMFSLRETFAVVAKSDLVVCNSSMIMHAAAAFRKPTVVLLGEFFASSKQHQVQWGYEDLTYCLGKEAGSSIISSVAEVLSVINAHLARS